MKRLFLKLFLSSADDLIAFLDHVEQHLRELADAGFAEAKRLDDEAAARRTAAQRAHLAARRVSNVTGD